MKWPLYHNNLGQTKQEPNSTLNCDKQEGFAKVLLLPNFPKNLKIAKQLFKFLQYIHYLCIALPKESKLASCIISDKVG